MATLISSIRFSSSYISNLYRNTELADVHFTFPNGDSTVQLPAHKLILASVSPVFKAMFYGPQKEGDIIKITDCTADVFEQFLQLIYFVGADLPNIKLQEMVRLANKYRMIEYIEKLMFELCRDENVVEIYELAMSIGYAKLQEFCEERIRKQTTSMLRTKSYLKGSRETLEQILKQKELDCSEFKLFLACLEWAKSSCRKNGLAENDSKNLINQLGNCLHLIGFRHMDGDDFFEILSNEMYVKLFTPDELTEIMRSKCDINFEPNIFKCSRRESVRVKCQKLRNNLETIEMKMLEERVNRY